MKKVKFFFVLFLGVQSFLWSNPIDGTPVIRFSELVFDNFNKWTMELYSPYQFDQYIIDSVILKTSSKVAKVLSTSYGSNVLTLITQDSLSIPISFNVDGDSIVIVTYSTLNNITSRREDCIMYGNYPYAKVGKPSVDFPSICRLFSEFNRNSWEIDCLAKYPSLGLINSFDSLSTIMQGHIYDMNNMPVAQSQIVNTIPCYFELETPLTIDVPGIYSTHIFRHFDKEIKKYLFVKSDDYEAFTTITAIEQFELNNIHHDTLVNQDIHLKTNEFIISSIEDTEPLRSEEFILINYPNPFNLSTNFFVKVPERMKEKTGVINIYNSNGELIRAIQFDNSSTVSWDGEDGVGNVMPSGIYLYQLDIDKQMMKSGSMILLK